MDETIFQLVSTNPSRNDLFEVVHAYHKKIEEMCVKNHPNFIPKIKSYCKCSDNMMELSLIGITEKHRFVDVIHELFPFHGILVKTIGGKK